MSKFRFTLLLLILLFASLSVSAQEVEDTIKIKTRVVFLDALVKDKKTNLPISNLTSDNFAVLDNGKPRNITHDAAYDTDPAWSPDGSTLVYSSDKVGGLLQLFLYDVKSGRERQLTRIPTQPIMPAFSPDGKRIAYLDVDGMWRRAGVA